MTWIKTVSMEDDPRVKAAIEAERKLYPQEYATPVPAVDRGFAASIVGSHTLLPDVLFHSFSAFGAMMTLFNVEVALLQGASFEQTALNIAIGVGVGMVTQGLLSPALGQNANPIWGIIAGSASAAATTAEGPKPGFAIDSPIRTWTSYPVRAA